MAQKIKSYINLIYFILHESIKPSVKNTIRLLTIVSKFRLMNKKYLALTTLIFIALSLGISYLGRLFCTTDFSTYNFGEIVICPPPIFGEISFYSSIIVGVLISLFLIRKGMDKKEIFYTILIAVLISSAVGFVHDLIGIQLDSEYLGSDGIIGWLETPEDLCSNSLPGMEEFICSFYASISSLLAISPETEEPVPTYSIASYYTALFFTYMKLPFFVFIASLATIFIYSRMKKNVNEISKI